MSATILETSSITKYYGKTKALDGISLQLKKGQVLGILGPNGSGKTTFLSVILGVLRPYSGWYRWVDGDVNSAPASIGALLEKPCFLPGNRLQTQLYDMAILHKIPARHRAMRIKEVLTETGLEDVATKKFSALSLGMKQRAAIAMALLSRPDILILDEPTNGLDPQGIIDIRQLIRQLAATGKTVILASHILDEVEKVCTHAAFFKKGVLAGFESLVPESTEDNPVYRLLLEVPYTETGKLLECLGLNPNCVLLEKMPNGAVVDFEPSEGGPELLNKFLAENNIMLSGLTKVKSGIEQSFMKITGEQQQHGH
ncbi:MAG: ABC transporter ATP-binding protein [Balneolales bacterium]|nr:ABC transporter ATP-binding protein [Balneolales bacterium]